MNEFFAPMIVQEQLPAHCGPASLSSCLAVLGLRATQRQIAEAAGARWSIWKDGLDQHRIRRAAEQWGARCDFLVADESADGQRFVRELREHLGHGLPAMVCVWESEH